MDAASRMMYAIVERSPLLVVAVQSGHRGEVVVVGGGGGGGSDEGNFHLR